MVRTNDKLSSSTLKFLDEELKRYQHIDRLIAQRILELDHPWRQTDENIGGEKSSTIYKLQENIVIKHESDKQLQRLLKLKKDCDKTVSQFDDEQQQIYQLMYLSSNCYDWDGVGELLRPHPVGHSTIYRKRYRLLEILAEEKGII